MSYSLYSVNLPPNVTPKELNGLMRDRRNEEYGRLTVLDVYGVHNKHRYTFWICRCECNKITIVGSNHLNSGHTTSCGCLQEEAIRSHGMSHSKEYDTWKHIKQRCYNPNCIAFPDYGGSGISVCDRWRESFEAFYEDMGDKPTEKHTIDRVNAAGDYAPENCVWATYKEQNDHLSTSLRITFDGETHSVGYWAREVGLNKRTLRARLEKGWSPQRALTTPADSASRNTLTKEPSTFST